MALTINYSTLQREIGRRLGWGRSPTGTATDQAWSADQLQDFQDIIDNGLRRFYWPMPLPGELRYIWSFLAPQSYLDCVIGQAIYQLPGDFSDLASSGFTYESGGNQLNVSRVSDQKIQSLQAKSPRSGPPQYYAIQSATSPRVITGFTSPQAIAFDGSGNMFVSNFGGTTVSVLTPGAATPTSTLTGLSAPGRMAFDAIGDLCVVETAANVVKQFAPGATTAAITYTGLTGPKGVAFDLSGNMFVSNAGTTTVSVFTRNVTTAASVLTGFTNPDGLLFDQRGNLYVANSGTNTVSVLAQGSTVATTVLTGVTAPAALALDSSGTLYAASATSVGVFPVGSTTPSYSLTGIAPNKLIVDRLDNLYVASNADGAVYKFAKGATTASSILNGLPNANGLAFDAGNNLYVGAFGNNTVNVFSPGADGSYGVGTTFYRSIFYPTPDIAYQLQYRYGITPQSLSDKNQFPLGGAVHSETILEACLAEADKALNQEAGPHEQRFRDLLAASMAYDKSLTAPTDSEAWPYDNVAQDLRIDLSYLQRIIGEAMGYGANKGAWNRTEFNKVEVVIQRGLRRFYWPIGGTTRSETGHTVETAPAHTWSFLMLNATLIVPASPIVQKLAANQTAVFFSGFASSGNWVLSDPSNTSSGNLGNNVDAATLQTTLQNNWSFNNYTVTGSIGAGFVITSPSEQTFSCTVTSNTLSPAVNIVTRSGPGTVTNPFGATDPISYELPNDFQQMMSGGFIYQGSNNPRLAEVSWEAMASLQATAPRVGPPEYYCIRARNSPAGHIARYEVLLYPYPDQSYKLLYQYGFMPTKLSDQDPYPLGSAQHAETILEACLAEASALMGQAENPHEAKFQTLLAASINQDATLAQPPNTPVWPYENPATSLTVNKAYLKRLIGEAMGYGPHPGIWDQTQGQKVKLALETGLRKFYSPPVLPGEKYGWEWSFLAPTSQMTMVPGKYEYDLPADFCNLEQPFVYQPNTTVMYPPIRIVSERQVMAFLQRTVAASMSTICCIRPKQLDQSAGTRYEVLFWPVPDQAYGLTYTYQIYPSMLGAEVALPFGGQASAQTIIEACLAAVEEIKGERGLHSELFMEHMRTSVSHDRKVNTPQTLGRNHDRSDRGYGRYWGYTGSFHDMQDQLVDYEGYNIG